jgi:hypothetical protein
MTRDKEKSSRALMVAFLLPDCRDVSILKFRSTPSSSTPELVIESTRFSEIFEPFGIDACMSTLD